MDEQGHVRYRQHHDHAASRQNNPARPSQNNECLTVTVNYKYNQSPLFPELPGMGVITPSTISSTNILQMSIPSS